jgi:hypothetical protein
MTDPAIEVLVAHGYKYNPEAGCWSKEGAQPEQEPVAWVCYGSSDSEMHDIDFEQKDVDALPVGTMLYTTPPQRTWVGLADDEIRHIYICTTGWSISDSDPMLVDFAENIEAKLKEKNT